MIQVTLSQEEFDALRKDAERYRKLRTKDWFSSPYCVVARPASSVKLGSDCPSHDRLDTLVDSEDPE